MFVDLDWPLNASSLLSASAELLVTSSKETVFYPHLSVNNFTWKLRIGYPWQHLTGDVCLTIKTALNKFYHCEIVAPPRPSARRLISILRDLGQLLLKLSYIIRNHNGRVTVLPVVKVRGLGAQPPPLLPFGPPPAIVWAPSDWIYKVLFYA